MYGIVFDDSSDYSPFKMGWVSAHNPLFDLLQRFSLGSEHMNFISVLKLYLHLKYNKNIYIPQKHTSILSLSILQTFRMANIHGLNSLNQNSNNDGFQQRPNNPANNNEDENASSMNDLFEESNNFTPNILVPFFSGARALKYPRDESCWDFLLYNMCPVFKFLSLTFAILLIDLAVFIATAVVGLNQEGTLLEIKATTLYMFKGSNPIAVYKGQFYRLICAIALHGNFIHLFGNSLVTLIILSRVQHTYGILWSIFIYVLTEVCGNLFSIVIQNNYYIVSVGASTALFGLMGLLLGYLIINWPALQFMGRLRCSLLMNIVMMIIFSILISATVTNVDNWAHFGGVISGLWISAIPASIKCDRRQKIIRGVFIGLLVVQVLICLLVFYLGKPGLKEEAAKY